MDGPDRRAGSRRKSDKLRLVFRDNWYRDIWLLGISVFVYVALTNSINEGHARRDQTCLLFEKQHATAVRQLASTYTYLSKLAPTDLHQPLNQAVLAQLPQIEADAKIGAPPYCDEPGVGLPEPNPRMPRRPGNLPQPPPPRT